jgi:hypothetical protein
MNGVIDYPGPLGIRRLGRTIRILGIIDCQYRPWAVERCSWGSEKRRTEGVAVRHNGLC